MAILEKRLNSHKFDEGDVLIKIGTPADGLYLLQRGRVNIAIPVAGSKGDYRIGTIDAGNMFGELALFDSSLRSATVVAATSGQASVLSASAVKDLQSHHPQVYQRLILAVGRSLADRLKRANAEIRALAQ